MFCGNDDNDQEKPASIGVGELPGTRKLSAPPPYICLLFNLFYSYILLLFIFCLPIVGFYSFLFFLIVDVYSLFCISLYFAFSHWHASLLACNHNYGSLQFEREKKRKKRRKKEAAALVAAVHLKALLAFCSPSAAITCTTILIHSHFHQQQQHYHL